ncbi:tryptophan halogenase [Asticcacaulis biprosthecium C19]|uniref:Tryptophan halogenase n=1 Tax=Asticcacaulis biprosthecium C19 TaxID=715226 RepID=F4QP47_9CAUL|nr:tryptophan halogenase family protein [Asticcacaulis biprosthecium]EGF91105.1 tryptophan halogenase [Asticcacaulis biprosthecium C19]
MTAGPVRRIVILGGGTAGWAAAAAMAKFGDGRDFDITVIDSSEIGTVGVGEASVPNIRNFNAWLGLGELDFIASTRGTFKLGIEFVDWRTTGTRFFHPFGRYGVDLEDVDFHQCLARARAAGFDAPLEAFSLPIAMARQDRFSQPVSDPRSPLSDYGYAYHFDAGLYAKRLRRYAVERNVKHLDRRVAGAAMKDNGHVDALLFDDGNRFEADLFIDCSGFRGLLIEGALKTGYDDWTHWLPCDRAVALPCRRAGSALEPYTHATAREAGWTWRIPLQHRVGNGYVYCSAFLDDQAAIDRLTGAMESDPLAEPNLLRFVTGTRKQFWNGNCVALGLAGGFIEPLESTSINLVHRALSTLMEYFPDTGFDPRLQAVANRRMRLETEHIRDFIILHYKASQRRDTAFWRQCADMTIPDSLALKMDAYRAAGHLLQFEAESFKPESWLTLFEGLGLLPETVEPLAGQIDACELTGPLNAMRASVVQAAQQAMPHAAFIERFCPAPAE